MAQIPLKTPTDSQNHTRQFRTEGTSEDPMLALSRIDHKVKKKAAQELFWLSVQYLQAIYNLSGQPGSFSHSSL